MIDLAYLLAAAYGLRLLYALTAAAETIAEALWEDEPEVPPADRPFGENTRRVGPPLEVVE